MRNLMLLLFCGIGLLLATACSAPAYVKEKGPDLTTLHQQARHVHLDTEEVAPVAAEQVGVTQLAAVLANEGSRPRPGRVAEVAGSACVPYFMLCIAKFIFIIVLFLKMGCMIHPVKHGV
jgi:hypothetical protein